MLGAMSQLKLLACKIQLFLFILLLYLLITGICCIKSFSVVLFWANFLGNNFLISVDISKMEFLTLVIVDHIIF